MSWLAEVRFDERGLVPVVAQEAATGEILMLAYANREALEHTIASGRAHYWSRRRDELWEKGATSGNVQDVVEVRLDCDGDSVLYRVRQTGPACHTLQHSCFFRTEADGQIEDCEPPVHSLARVEQMIAGRQATPVEGSYTNYLLDQGIDKILKKVGEEATEVVIAAKNEPDDALRSEVADLLYHLVVLLRARNLPLERVWNELDQRFGRTPRPRGPRPETSSRT